MRRQHLLFGVFIIGLSVEIFLKPNAIDDLMASAQDVSSRIKILVAVVETIQRSYVEETHPEQLVDDAIRGIIAGLDPHTTYLPVDNFEKWNQHFEGYSGIGITYAVIRQHLTVISVIDGGPAQRAGLRAGDRIIEINGARIIGLRHDEVPQRIMGASGSHLLVTVERNGWHTPRRLEVVRDHVQITSIPVSAIIRPGIGYIKIDRFSTTTREELDEAIAMLTAEGMEKLVVDLRGNSGGYLSTAVEVADKFLPAGRLIVFTRGRSPSSFQEYTADDDRNDYQRPMIVLIDHATASASEIVAGALQDWDRALIVGKNSFGKGLVQSQYRFADGSALLMTTAKYYTPSGRLIQRSYAGKTKDEYYFEAYDDSLINDEKHVDTLKYQTSSGRTVYGGGGITPDVAVVARGTVLDEELRRLYYGEQRVFYTFIRDFLERHPSVRQDSERFIRAFRVTDAMLNDLAKLANELHVKVSPSCFVKNREVIKFLVKRDLAYFVWGETARLKINMEKDVQLGQAIIHFPEAEALLSANKTTAATLHFQQKE
jgi:carboxyl-terminal processing protease